MYERKLSKKLIELAALETSATIEINDKDSLSWPETPGCRLSKWPLSNVTRNEGHNEDHNGNNDDGR